MTTKTVKLSQVKVNERNPRTITARKLDLLAERLLAFPKMIKLRPVVVDNRMKALGGNMRLRAFAKIAAMSLDDVAATLAKTKNFQRMTQAEREVLLANWQEWLTNPVVEICNASELTEAEQKEFIIADNASFGEWDYDALANEWDAEDLNSWGVDVWRPDAVQFGGAPEPAADETIDPTALPPELQGVDINPDDLPKIEGSDETLMERVIIVYPKEREGEIASLLGLEKIEKVLYNIDEVGK